MVIIIILKFQADNINTLCRSMVELAQSQCSSLVADTTALCNKFKKLFKLFAKCHEVYDQNYVTDNDINDLGRLL